MRNHSGWRAWLSGFILLGVLAALGPAHTYETALAQDGTTEPVTFSVAPPFQSFVQTHGGARTLGAPISGEFLLLGKRIQIFERQVLEVRAYRSVGAMDLLDAGLPLVHADGQTFPTSDPSLVSTLPSPTSTDYGEQALAIITDGRFEVAVPDEWDGWPVNFGTTFRTTTVCEDLAAETACDDVTLLSAALDVWGLPTSAPMTDPHNPELIYLRFQRGIMQFSASDARTVHLRDRRRSTDRLAMDGGLTLRIPFEPPLAWNVILRFLSDRAVPGVESVEGGTYRRTISVDGAPGVLEVWLGGDDFLMLRAHLPYWEGLIHVVARIAGVFGVNNDVSLGAAHLAEDPILGSLVSAQPGVRVPGAWGPLEAGVHAVLAEHTGAEGAKEVMGWLVERCGQRVPGLARGLTHLFPSAEILAESEMAGGPTSRVVLERVQMFARAVVERKVVLSGMIPLDEFVASVASVPGVGATAAHQLAMRLGQRDAYPGSAPDVLAAVNQLGVVQPDVYAECWRPWRALAAMYLISRER